MPGAGRAARTDRVAGSPMGAAPFYGQLPADRLFQTMRPARFIFRTNRPYAFLHHRPHVIPVSCFLRSRQA
ncbi:hypothetical protein BN2475_100109 [Paraburkholderia ribeironis]|uniref:Uncharacterized protein n=1 Tax=Paraburkholderia ribeironis TaxID=1247936 RepID=A0A1N7RPQ4_9BURK|nr:hypothetical protein BN2475_100109 [Paraburkholderia ribeironis]